MPLPMSCCHSLCHNHVHPMLVVKVLHDGLDGIDLPCVHINHPPVRTHIASVNGGADGDCHRLHPGEPGSDHTLRSTHQVEPGSCLEHRLEVRLLIAIAIRDIGTALELHQLMKLSCACSPEG